MFILPFLPQLKNLFLWYNYYANITLDTEFALLFAQWIVIMSCRHVVLSYYCDCHAIIFVSLHNCGNWYRNCADGWMASLHLYHFVKRNSIFQMACLFQRAWRRLIQPASSPANRLTSELYRSKFHYTVLSTYLLLVRNFVDRKLQPAMLNTIAFVSRSQLWSASWIFKYSIKALLAPPSQFKCAFLSLIASLYVLLAVFSTRASVSKQ